MALVANSPGVNLATETTKRIISEPLPGPGTLPYVVKKAAPKFKPLLSPIPSVSIKLIWYDSYLGNKSQAKSPRVRQPLYNSPNLPSNWPPNLAFIEHITPETLNEVNYMLRNENFDNNYNYRRRSTHNFNDFSSLISINKLNKGSSTSRRYNNEEEIDLDRTYVNNQYLFS